MGPSNFKDIESQCQLVRISVQGKSTEISNYRLFRTESIALENLSFFCQEKKTTFYRALSDKRAICICICEQHMTDMHMYM